MTRQRPTPTHDGDYDDASYIFQVDWRSALQDRISTLLHSGTSYYLQFTVRVHRLTAYPSDASASRRRTHAYVLPKDPPVTLSVAHTPEAL